MPFFVYILRTVGTSKLTTYVGYTKDLKKRLKLHNSGKGAKFTRGRKWKLLYSERFRTKKQAISREYYIKRNRKIRNLIKDQYL